MKNLLFILLLGLGFSQTEVSQKVFDIEVFDQFTIYNLNELISEYELDWAVISIVECSAEECSIEQQGNTNSTHTLRSPAVGLPSYYPNQGTNSSFFAPNNMSIQIQIGGFTGAHTMKLLVTAEFPEEDTGYIEEGFEFCLNAGANLVSYPCDNPVPVGDALPSGIENFVTAIIGQGVATEYNSALGWIGSLDSFNEGGGYWFKSNSAVCFEYECVAN